MNLVSPLERQPSHRIFIELRRSLCLSASLGIRPRVCPASDMSCFASTPRRHCCPRSAEYLPAFDTFRPRGFSPPRRFTPLTGLGFVAPRSRMGFVAFLESAPTQRQPKPTINGEQSSFPATRFTPSEEFPSSVAVPHHCGRCPLVVCDASRPLDGTSAF